MRRPRTDVWPTVRGRELPCRHDWSRDLWEVRHEGESDAEVCIVGLKVWSFRDEPALDELPGDLLGLLVGSALAKGGAECGPWGGSAGRLRRDSEDAASWFPFDDPGE